MKLFVCNDEVFHFIHFLLIKARKLGSIASLVAIVTLGVIQDVNYSTFLLPDNKISIVLE